MARKETRPTFAEIVRDVRAQPTPPPADPRSINLAHGIFADRDGGIWRIVAAGISSERAVRLAAEGAAVAWDACGCGGYCGLDWFGPAEVSRMVAAGGPRARQNRKHRGELSEWRSDDGRSLVLAEGEVSWGDLLG